MKADNPKEIVENISWKHKSVLCTIFILDRHYGRSYITNRDIVDYQIENRLMVKKRASYENNRKRMCQLGDEWGLVKSIPIEHLIGYNGGLPTNTFKLTGMGVEVVYKFYRPYRSLLEGLSAGDNTILKDNLERCFNENTK